MDYRNSHGHVRGKVIYDERNMDSYYDMRDSSPRSRSPLRRSGSPPPRDLRATSALSRSPPRRSGSPIPFRSRSSPPHRMNYSYAEGHRTIESRPHLQRDYSYKETSYDYTASSRFGGGRYYDYRKYPQPNLSSSGSNSLPFSREGLPLHQRSLRHDSRSNSGSGSNSRSPSPVNSPREWSHFSQREEGEMLDERPYYYSRTNPIHSPTKGLSMGVDLREDLRKSVEELRRLKGENQIENSVENVFSNNSPIKQDSPVEILKHQNSMNRPQTPPQQYHQQYQQHQYQQYQHQHYQHYQHYQQYQHAHQNQQYHSMHARPQYQHHMNYNHQHHPQSYHNLQHHQPLTQVFFNLIFFSYFFTIFPFLS